MDRLRIHIDDDVLGNDLGCVAVRRSGVANQTAGAWQIPEWAQHRIDIPDRILLIPRLRSLPLLARIRAEERMLRTEFGRRIRFLLHPHVAAHSHALLKQAAAAEQSFRRRDWEQIVVYRENTSAPDGLRTYRGALSGGRTVSLANSATLAGPRGPSSQWTFSWREVDSNCRSHLRARVSLRRTGRK